ncbi:MAG: ATP synthase F1 subunit delta [Acidobacteria bacterium]|nr:ATP synthase F1 subunit delta [Acidobacteriota bacterium]
MSQRVDDRQLALARVYSESLLELAEEQGVGDEILEELDALVSLQERDSDLRVFFSSPLVAEAARRSAIEKSFRDRASDLLVDTLQVMNNKGRLALLPALAVAYRAVLDERRGRVEVSVTSAVELGAELRQKLLDTLGRVAQREIRLTETVDPETLGGLIVSVSDRKIDYSLASDLRQLEDQLRDRATREIHRVT